jgi:CO dehydrogenase/acetyl-CoA synthase epsilon subunit
MKRIFFSTLLLLIVSGTFSQDLKKVKSYYDAKQLDKAKTEIDAYNVKNANNPEGLYYKSKIYASLASNEQFKSLTPDAKAEAFDAFKKAVETDKDNKLMIIMVQDQYKPIFDVYTGYYDAAISAFNTAATSKSKADFETSMNNFIKANEVGNYISTKKWALSEVDTSLVLNIGKAAVNAGKPEIALQYFKKLTDANITHTKDDNTGYSFPYQWLANYYGDAKDDANFMKYVNLGKQNFPKDDYFDAVMLDYYRAKKDYPSLFKAYNDVVTRYPDSLLYHFNYANEIFNYVYNSDAGTKIENKEELLNTVGSELEKASKLNADYTNTNWLYGQYFFNSGIDLRDKALAIKGTKPDDVKNKADLNAQAKAAFTKSIPYAEKAAQSMEAGYKKTERSHYKSVADLMQRIYSSLNQPDKVKNYQQKYDAADAKFVN